MRKFLDQSYVSCGTEIKVKKRKVSTASSSALHFHWVLKLSQVSTYIKVRTVNLNVKVRRSAKSLKILEIIETEQGKLKNQEISRLEFLQMLATNAYHRRSKILI